MARRSRFGAAELIGILLVIGLVLLILKWALITAAILAVPFGMWWLYDRHTARRREAAARERAAAQARRRAEVEGRAVVDAAGGCGWCGSRPAHRDRDGRPVLPLEFHHDEIEEVLRLTPAT
ncbi:MAG TPA: hypothetical protein VM367_08600 [Pseudonocardia sp.]|jgi:hypothetical protein|nr:hypothetical protein [Pseudonocardia sp.]